MSAQIFNNKLFKRAFIGAVLLTVVLLGSLAVGAWRSSVTQDKPKLGLMTSLPLRWGEGELGAILDPASKPLPAYQSLESEYRISLIDGVDAKSLKGIDVLMMAQPRALSPAEFTALDGWIRDGGSALILADPALAWESMHPLGDKRRPLFTSLMSPLFSHWGLDLVLPMEGEGEEEKTVLRQISGQAVQTVTAGAWQPRGGAKAAQCAISDEAMIAQCLVGKGRAILIADADLLEAEFWQGTGMRVVSGNDDFGNMALIKQYLRQIADLQQNTGKAANAK